MGYVGFAIGDKHTYRDWGLQCYDYKITFPEKQKELMQIPGRNGKIDVAWEQTSEAYGHRKIEIFCDAPDKDYASWVNLVSDITNYVQDEYLAITPDFDTEYYYRGWATVSSSKDHKSGSDIKFTIDAEPYKLKQESTKIQVSVAGETTVTVSNDKMQVRPRITTDGDDVMIVVGGLTYSYKTAGVYARAGFVLPPGETELKILGTANVTIEYQEGKL